MLEELLALPEQLARIGDELRSFAWDSEEELVTLEAAHLMTVLRRYHEGELSAEQVSEWTEALEVRDDVGFDTRCEGLIREIVYELANPELEGRLSTARADQLVSRLSACVS